MYLFWFHLCLRGPIQTNL
uniref:Uncharacterized protein n=1 Tax=Anguilla anguilla TaxID=7936 RepID=A0A0E9USZ0_ANGAN